MALCQRFAQALRRPLFRLRSRVRPHCLLRFQKIDRRSAFRKPEQRQGERLFTDGVQNEILTDLAKVADLKVISRTSVNQYREAAGRNLRKIGRGAGVAHVLEGSVQRASGRVR